MASLSFLIRYISHQLRAKTEYNLHSPFLYSFYLEVIRGKSTKVNRQDIERVRRELLHDHRLVSVQDLGAGPQGKPNPHRSLQVGDIAARALKPPHLAQIIGRIARFCTPGMILELGTSLGITTSYLARYCPSVPLTTVEGSAEIAQLARQTFDKLNLSGINLLVGNFDEVLPALVDQIPDCDTLFYIDGNHRYEATMRYFKLLLTNTRNKSVFIFDDIHWSGEMEDAWRDIQHEPRVFLTLDLFYFGLVFLLDNREKEHVRLRLF